MCVDNDPVYIIMELMPGGDLLKFLREAKMDHVRKLNFRSPYSCGWGEGGKGGFLLGIHLNEVYLYVP